MSEKSSFKCSGKVSQSLSSGMLAIEVYFASDSTIDQVDAAKMLSMFQSIETEFKDKGHYKMASVIPNNMKDLANSKQDATSKKLGINGNGGQD